LRWRGNFSELDTAHWTEGLKRALNYDPQTAAAVDNGSLLLLLPVPLTFGNFVDAQLTLAFLFCLFSPFFLVSFLSSLFSPPPPSCAVAMD